MIDVEVRTHTGMRTVRAYETDCPHLVIHRNLDCQWRWTITHKPTGYAVMVFDTLTLARRAVKILAGIRGWHTLNEANVNVWAARRRSILREAARIANDR